MQKGQTSGFSGHSHRVDTVHSGLSGCSTQWTQYAVHSGCSGIVVYGGGDIVFDTKRSNKWMQYTVDAVRSGCSGKVVYGGGDIVFGAKRSNQWMQYTVDAVCSGCSMQWMQ